MPNNPPTGQPAATGPQGPTGPAATTGPSAGPLGGTPTPAKRGSRASTLRVRGGKREVKGYAVAKSELWTLGGLQAGSALCFSLSGICFGQWSSIKQQIDLAPPAAKASLAYWQGVGDMAWYGMIGLLVVALALIAISGLNVWNIIKSTQHD